MQKTWDKICWRQIWDLDDELFSISNWNISSSTCVTNIVVSNIHVGLNSTLRPQFNSLQRWNICAELQNCETAPILVDEGENKSKEKANIHWSYYKLHSVQYKHQNEFNIEWWPIWTRWFSWSHQISECWGSWYERISKKGSQMPKDLIGRTISTLGLVTSVLLS